jgi:hypothetical protein
VKSPNRKIDERVCHRVHHYVADLPWQEIALSCLFRMYVYESGLMTRIPAFRWAS